MTIIYAVRIEDYSGKVLKPVTDANHVIHGDTSLSSAMSDMNYIADEYIHSRVFDEKYTELSRDLSQKIGIHKFLLVRSDIVHGMEISKDGFIDYMDGSSKKTLMYDLNEVRFNPDIPIRAHMSRGLPPVSDGAICINTLDNNVYLGRDGQWTKAFLDGDELMPQSGPTIGPTLVQRTGSSIEVIHKVSGKTTEYRIQGGSWQASGLFESLSPNQTYRIEARYKGDGVFKDSPASPVVGITTLKLDVPAPPPPDVTKITDTSATVIAATGYTGAEVSLNGGRWWPAPKVFNNLLRNTVYTARARLPETTTTNASPASTEMRFSTLRKDDLSGAPGDAILKVGTMQEGYFGKIEGGWFVDVDRITSELGITEGTMINEHTHWHKFAWKGKTLFIPQKPIRHSISWNHLNSKGVVYGKNIVVNGVTYKVRLLKGALTDPSKNDDPDRGHKGSEWNRLILPLHQERKGNNWANPSYVEGDLQDWGTYLSNSDMAFATGRGIISWCQEVSGANSKSRVSRGFFSVSGALTLDSSFVDDQYGWRPVFEVVV